MASNKKGVVPVLEPYNPLNKQRLGEQVADALLEQPICKLPPSKFIGAGVYALYYTGDLPAYSALSRLCRHKQYRCPIYVGKAVPEGSRKGGQVEGDDQGTALFKRLKDHAKSIEAVENLKLSDFHCQFLAVDDIWIPLAETMVIERFKPVWNCLLEGFGNHAPGGGRKDMVRPAWDQFHPGRKWASSLKPYSKSKEQLERDIRAYLHHTLDKP